MSTTPSAAPKPLWLSLSCTRSSTRSAAASSRHRGVSCRRLRRLHPDDDTRHRITEVVTGPFRDVLLDGAGHWIQQERPAEVNAELLAFLQGVR